MLSMQPTTMIPLIALVTAIKGVCKAGVTFQITMYPVKIAKMKIPTLVTNSISEENPNNAVNPKETRKMEAAK